MFPVEIKNLGDRNSALMCPVKLGVFRVRGLESTLNWVPSCDGFREKDVT